MAKPDTISLQASAVSQQRVVNAKSVLTDSTVGELVEGLVSAMALPKNDPAGAPLTYSLRLEREGRHLHSSEVVGDALREADKVTLQPQIDAGAQL